jgi:hypothetical protein
MPEIGLKRPRVVSPISQRKTVGVPEHVRVRLEGQLGHLSCSCDHSGESGRREWRAALRCEHEGRLRLLFALEPSESAQLVPEDRMF